MRFFEGIRKGWPLDIQRPNPLESVSLYLMNLLK